VHNHKEKLGYNKGDNPARQNKVLSGKGKEYSEAAQDIENTFFAWLNFAGVSEEEFDKRMSCKPHKIEETINEDGNIEINIYGGGTRVIDPLLYQIGGDIDIDDFIVSALLVLSLIASRYEDKSFENEVRKFADRMIAERKLTI